MKTNGSSSSSESEGKEKEREGQENTYADGDTGSEKESGSPFQNVWPRYLKGLRSRISGNSISARPPG